MNAKKFYLLIVIGLVMGLIPQRNVSADMGPKPTMEFEFTLEGIGFDEIKSIKLMECGYSKVGEDGYLFEENFPPEAQQYFGSCELSGCAFSYYDFDVYHQLVIQLSNGTTLKSNVFRNSYFDSRFKVLIQRDSLVVDELKGADFRERMIVPCGTTPMAQPRACAACATVLRVPSPPTATTAVRLAVA